jgi:hypothetical protein
MRRPFVRVLTRPLVLVAAVMAIPLVSAVPAASDGVVVGGFPVDVSDSPWTVALSSRDRFGGMRSGQFCGAVAVGPTTVLTAAHCMGEEVLGVPPGRAHDLKVVAGRTDLYSDVGQEIAVNEIWVNPAYDSYSNSGDFAVLKLAEPLPQASVIAMTGAGDPAYSAGTEAMGYAPLVCMCCGTASARTLTQGRPTVRTGRRRWCVPGSPRGAATPARETAAGHWSPRAA